VPKRSRRNKNKRKELRTKGWKNKKGITEVTEGKRVELYWKVNSHYDKQELFEEKVKIARKVFGGGTLALDEKAEVKQVDVKQEHQAKQ
jgi:hypothetical protein